MTTTYSYEIATAFPYGQWDQKRLTQEIQNSDDITKILDSKPVANGDNVDVTFTSDLTVDEKTFLDNVIAQHNGEPLRTDPDPVILEPTGDSAKSLIIYGLTFTPTPGNDSNHDVVFDHARDLQGLIVEITGHADGDTLRVAVVHPTEATELRVLAEGDGVNDGVPIPPSAGFSVMAEGTAPIPAGVRLRFKYHSEDSEGAPKVYAYLRQWKNGSS